MIATKWIDQDELRKGLATWHDKYQTPYSKMARIMAITPQYLSMFINGERENVSYELGTRIYENLRERGFIS